MAPGRGWWHVPVIVLALVASASAQERPAPCVGFAAEDPPGDQRVAWQGFTTPVAAQDNLDITGLFFRNDGARQTANVVFANLHKTAPLYATNGLDYWLSYSTTRGSYFAEAWVDPDDGSVVFYYGRVREPESYVKGAGRFIEGRGGIIEFVLPHAMGGAPGTKLFPVVMESRVYEPGAYTLVDADRLPDTGWTEFAGTPCAVATSAPSRPASQPGARPAPTVSVTSVSPRARKAARTRRLTVGLRTTEPLTRVRVRLLRGRRVAGTARAARLDRSGELTLRLRKGFRAGAHRLVVSARRADGAAITRTVALKVR